MKMKKIMISVIAFLLFLTPVKAQDTIYIQTADDLLNLSKNCMLDSYSKDLKVELATDLDLTYVDYKPIPIFFGEFNGKGHSIKGLKINTAGSTLGLFRINSGTIKNVDVTANITPSGSSSKIGVIAGENNGKIINCKSFGEIKGKNQLGGIVGENNKKGIIKNCNSSVFITGSLHVGGICGLNNGLIQKCDNSGLINTSANQINTSNFFTIEDIKNEFLAQQKKSTIEVFSCVGGICGQNENTIINCSNIADIGYVHIGYNVGGITGVQKGIIKDCYNLGRVSGRKDIGGICGQFEPNIKIENGKDFSAELKREFDTLYVQLNTLNNQVNKTTNVSLDKSKQINDSLKDIETSLKNTSTSLNETSKDKIDELHSSLDDINLTTSNMIKDYKNISNDIINDVDKSRSTFSEITKQLIDTFNYTNDTLSQTNPEVSEQLKQLKEQTDRLLSLEENFNNINKNAKDNAKQLDDKIFEINSSIATLKSTVKSINSPKTFIKGVKKIRQTLKQLKKQSEDLRHISDDLSFYSPKNTEKIISTTFDSLNKSSELIQEITDKVSETASDTSKALSENNSKSLEQIDISKKSLNETLKNLNTNSQKLNQTLADHTQNLNSQSDNIEDIINDKFNASNETLHRTYEDVYKKSLIVNSNLNDLINTSKINNSSVNGTVSSINDTFKNIGTIIEKFTRKPNYSYENIFDYEENKDKKGIISHCENDGIITGDSDVGGTCGIISFEIGNNPEKDLMSNKNILKDAKALLRAITYKCINNGTINCKTDYAGGIVGKSTTGVIYDCVNKGNINGIDFLGGICGYCKGNIFKSNVLCDINGKNNIGGITGYALNISNNNCMVRIYAKGEKIGAIAGQIDEDSTIENNIFVFENIGAIDGVSYAGKAFPLSYDDFIKLENIPDYYNTLSVRFYDKSKLVKTVKVNYGGKIDPEQIPETPYDEQTYTQWENFPKNNIIRSINVNLEYKPWITTISSNERIPLFLIEGHFFPSDSITITPIETNYENKDYTDATIYKYKINGGTYENKKDYYIRVHLLENETIKLIKNDTITDVEYVKDGNYAIFRGQEQGKVIILKIKEKNYLVLIPVILGIITIFILFKEKVLLIVQKIKK